MLPHTHARRVQYEETILDLKKKVEEATEVPVDKQLLFWHFKELTDEFNDKTLLDLNLHTGFSLTGYDLREAPHYWPPVTKTPQGLLVVTNSTFPNEVRAFAHFAFVELNTELWCGVVFVTRAASNYPLSSFMTVINDAPSLFILFVL